MLTGSVAQSSSESNNSTNETDSLQDNEQESIANALIAEHGQEAVNETLQWAGDSLDESTSQMLNDKFQGEEASLAYQTLDTLKKNPDFINTEHTAFTEDTVNQLEAEFGDDGSALVTINAAISAGHLTKGEALKLVMKSPSTMRAAFEAAKAGLLTWSI